MNGKKYASTTLMERSDLVHVASLTALAVVLKLRFFEIPYMPAPFLKYDVSGVPLALIAFTSLKYTPSALLVYFLIHLLLGADPIGMAMKCLAEASTFAPLVSLYRSGFRRRTVIAGAVATRTAVMTAANYAVTPHWLILARWAVTFEDAYAKTLAYLPHIAIFNASLALIVATLSIVVYSTLKKAGYIL